MKTAKKIEKIVFIETKSPHIHVYSGSPIPRLGSVLLGTILRNLGYQVKVFIEEIFPVDMESFLDADLIGISVLTSTAPRSYRWANLARKVGIPVVLGGTHVSFFTDEALGYSDFVIRGEAEESLVEFVRCLESGGDLSKIAGLSYWDGDVQVHNPERANPLDLDRFPIPDFSLVPGTHSTISISTLRGCPFECTFCSVNKFNGKVIRSHSVDRVLDEIGYHMGQFPIQYIFFADDIFNVNRGRMKQILEGMIRRELTPKWGAQVRHEVARDKEALELMQRANCERVFVGFESINPKTLDLFKKHETVEDIERAIVSFHKHKIKVHGMFVLGSDEDTVETAEATLKFSKRWDIDTIQFLALTPLPGAEDFEPYIAGEKSLLSRDWSLYDGHHVVHTPKRMSPYQLQRGIMNGMKRFYSLGSVGKNLIKGELYNAIIRLAGHRLIKNWYKDKENIRYIEWLKTRSQSDSLEPSYQKQTIRKASIAIAQLIESQSSARQSLQIFFDELGVKVVDIKQNLSELIKQGEEDLFKESSRIGKSLCEYLEGLKGTVDYVVVASDQSFEKLHVKILDEFEELSTAIKSMIGSIPGIINIDLKTKMLEESLTKVGLMFTDDLERIKRACDKALAVAY